MKIIRKRMALTTLRSYASANNYFALYIFLLSIPNILMWHLNPHDKGLIANITNFAFTEVLLILPVLFLRLRTFMIIWLVFILLLPLEIVHIVNYGGFTTLPALSSGLDSNPSEIREFISNYRHIFQVFFIIIPVSIFCIVKTGNRNTYTFEKQVLIAMLILFCLLFSTRTIQELGIEKLLHNQTKLYSRLLTTGFPTGYFYNVPAFLYERKKLFDAQSTKRKFTFGVNHVDDFYDKPKVVILIIGETSRSANWSLSGYNRETNPELKKLQGLVYFDNALTAATHTRESIQLALSRATPDNLTPIYTETSIVSAYKEAGYKTIWISNQNQLSPVDTPVTVIAKEANEQIFTNKDYQINPSFDEELLPIIGSALENNSKLFLVVHTLGSHEIYRKRYPESFKKFKPTTSGDDYNFSSEGMRAKLINSYDNSILYTDHIISSIIKLVKEKNEIGFVSYFSDHGENILDGGTSTFGHGGIVPTDYVLNVPVLLWFSDKYIISHEDFVLRANANKHKNISLNGLFDTMLQLSGLSIKSNQLSESFIEPNAKNLSILTTEGKVINR